jgi:hypothetical protein
MAARQKEYASQFEAEMQSAADDADRRKSLADERAKAEQDVIDQTKSYADQFAQLAEASDRRMQEIIDTREFERKAAEDLANQTEDYAKMFEAAIDEGAKSTTGAAWDKERERLAGRTSQGTFSGWRLGQMYNAEQIDKEQLAVLKKISDYNQKIAAKIGVKGPQAFYYT